MSAGDVITEIRRQCGLHNSAPFNLKYLDVEGNQTGIVFDLGYINLGYTCF